MCSSQESIQLNLATYMSLIMLYYGQEAKLYLTNYMCLLLFYGQRSIQYHTFVFIITYSQYLVKCVSHNAFLQCCCYKEPCGTFCLQLPGEDTLDERTATPLLQMRQETSVPCYFIIHYTARMEHTGLRDQGALAYKCNVRELGIFSKM